MCVGVAIKHLLAFQNNNNNKQQNQSDGGCTHFCHRYQFTNYKIHQSEPRQHQCGTGKTMLIELHK